MKKFLTFILILLTVGVCIFVCHKLRNYSQPVYRPPVATYDQALYEKFLAAQDAGDYVAMNDAYDSNMRETGVPFTDDYDPTHGGLIYTYSYTATVGSKKRVSGKLFIVTEDLDRAAQTFGENDYFAVDRRTAADPEFIVMDSYRADNEAIVRCLCQLLLKHEADRPTDWDRSLESMISEWMMHNLAYNMDYKTDHSQHVNLNNADEATDWLQRAMEELQ